MGVIPTGQPVQATAQADPEQEAWELAKRRDTAQSYQAYLDIYPSGRFANPARVALQGLKPVAPTPPPTQPVQASQPAQQTPQAQTRTNQVIDGRYEILANGTEVKDRQTGLIWQRCAVGQQWSGSTCAGDAGKFQFENAQRLAGAGWRVPNIRELASLIVCSSGKMKDADDVGDGGPPVKNNCDSNFTRPTIQTQAFPNLPGTWFWSASNHKTDPNFAQIVNFYDGYPSSDHRGQGNFVRLVRSGQ